MSKFDIGVGEDFPLDEGRPQQDDCGGHRGWHHRHHHHHEHHHHHDHEGHHHGHHGRHHAHMAALAMLFARAYRGRMRNSAEPE